MKKADLKFHIDKIFIISWITFSIVSCIVVVFLSEWIQKEGILTFPSGFRHLFILLVFFLNWIKFGRRLKLNQFYTLGVFLILLYLVIAFLFVSVTPKKYILGTGFTFLFALIFLLGSNTITQVSLVIKILKYLLAFFIIMSISPILQGLLTGHTLRDVPPGLFRELGAFGSSMNIGVIICLSLYIITGERKYLYFSIFLSFGVFFTILKKSIFSNILVWISFAFFQLPSRKRLKLLIYGSFFVILSYSLVGDAITKDIKKNIAYYKGVGASQHVRMGMYIASFKIANDYFPFGSGMGTFGSLASITGEYSQVYIDYGVSKIGLNSPEAVKSGYFTLLDTYWPHILGELGFLGAMLFLTLWLFPLISTSRIVHNCREPIIRGFGFYIIIIILIMSNEGFTLYTPEIPAFVILHSGVAGLCYFHVHNYKKSLPE
jgi:hypothetical protein